MPVIPPALKKPVAVTASAWVVVETPVKQMSASAGPAMRTAWRAMTLAVVSRSRPVAEAPNRADAELSVRLVLDIRFVIASAPQ
jgi:hypothetical protein